MDSKKTLLFAVTAAVTATATAAIYKYIASKKKPKLKLCYFNLEGLGEPIRQLCVYLGLPFEDCRVTYDEFMKLKEDGTLKFGQVPALFVNDKHVLIQSGAILRFLGVIGGVHPRCPAKAALVDALLDQNNDLMAGVKVSRYSARFGFSFLDTEQEKRMMVRRELNDVILPKHLTFLETQLKESKTGWIANTCRPSIADFQLVGSMKYLSSGANDGISTEILKPFPLINDWVEKFYALPAIKTYYDSKK